MPHYTCTRLKQGMPGQLGAQAKVHTGQEQPAAPHLRARVGGELARKEWALWRQQAQRPRDLSIAWPLVRWRPRAHKQPLRQPAQTQHSGVHELRAAVRLGANCTFKKSGNCYVQGVSVPPAAPRVDHFMFATEHIKETTNTALIAPLVCAGRVIHPPAYGAAHKQLGTCGLTRPTPARLPCHLLQQSLLPHGFKPCFA